MRVAGYIRVSTVQQDLSRQKKLIQDFCSERNYSLVRLESDKVSGAKDNREGLKKILSLTKEDVDLVIISELSRLSREDDAHKIITKIYDILDNGLDLIFLDNTSKVYKASEGISFQDYLILAVQAFGAADERKHISKRMTTGLYQKLDLYPNMVAQSHIPFGYKAVDNPNYVVHSTPKSFIVIDEETSKYVKMIYQYTIEGKTTREIAQIMTNMGIDMIYTRISKIIRNPFYKGERIIKGKTYKVDAIVSPEIWDKAQQKIASNMLFKGNTTKHCFPLKNILKCPCGHNMYGLYKTTASSVYVCISKTFDEGRCNNSGVNLDILNQAVWLDVKKRFLDEEYQAKNTEEIDKIIATNLTLEDNISDLKKDIDSLISKIDKLANKIALEEDELLSSALRRQFLKYKEELQTKESSVSNIYSMITENNLKIDSLTKIEKQEELENIEDEEKKELYQKLLDRVVFYSERQRIGFIIIDYKNGFRSIYAYLSKRTNHLYWLPAAFRFNPNNRKVSIKKSELDNESKSDFANLSETEEYFVSDLKNLIQLDKYEIITLQTLLKR